MKKIYNFSVEVNVNEKKQGIASKIMEDVRKDLEEQEATRRVNDATSILHRDILQEFVDAVNDEIEDLGLAFSEVNFKGILCNNYNISQSVLNLKMSNQLIFLSISPQYRKVDFSKYTTYCGEYSLTVQIGSLGGANTLNKETPMEDLFSRIEDALKSEYAKRII